MREGTTAVLCVWSLLAAVVPRCATAAVSQLWGQSGEKWNNRSPLPDFSKAGFEAGDISIPNAPAVVNVKTYGATGNGTTDDSVAFQNALNAVRQGGVIFIPTGRYVITRQLKITVSNTVLRGAGRASTILYFPKPLSQIVGAAATYAPGGSWSWSGGVIYARGQDNGAQLTPVTAAASRGDVSLTVASTARLSVGETVRLILTDSGGALGRMLYDGLSSAPADMNNLQLVDFPVKIQAIAGNLITLNRRLPLDVSLNCAPAIYAYAPSLHHIGVEDLAIQFPVTLYAGHFLEPGYNAIDFDGVSDGWISSIQITNADSGIFFRNGTRRCTIDTVRFSAGSGRTRTGYGGTDGNTTTVCGGHHGILMDGLVTDNLITHFQFDFRFIHDLALSAYSTGNVFAAGQGYDTNLDQHRRGPYSNCFTDIDAGLGTRLWESGGDASEGPPSGAWQTFWNIRTRASQSAPPWALDAVLVGWTTASSGLLSQSPSWIEAVSPTTLTPTDIYLAERGLTQPLPPGTPTNSSNAQAAPNVRVYPNPWRADRNPSKPVTFDNVPVGSEIKIFTVSGHEVRTLNADVTTVPWDLQNDSGRTVASGLYLYLIKFPNAPSARGKLAVIR